MKKANYPDMGQARVQAQLATELGDLVKQLMEALPDCTLATDEQRWATAQARGLVKQAVDMLQEAQP